MIYDSFIYYNEIDLLRARLVEHAPFVDRFVIVEGDRTFVGRRKEQFLDLKDPRIAEFAKKIILVRAQLDEHPRSAWDNEIAQRNAIFTHVDYRPTDHILVSDLDELVGRRHWKSILSEAQSAGVVPIKMRNFYYYINLLTPEVNARQKMVRYDMARSKGWSAQELRMLDLGMPRRTRGYHFSYLGSIPFIQNKIANFSHQEYNTPEFQDERKLAETIRAGSDLFGRCGAQFEWVPVTRRWPLEMLINPLWKSFVFPPPTLKLRLFGWLKRRHPDVP